MFWALRVSARSLSKAALVRPLPKSSLGETESRAAWRDWALSMVRERFLFLRDIVDCQNVYGYKVVVKRAGL